MLKADPVDSPLGRRMSAAHAVAIAALREAPRSSLELDRLMAGEVGPEATATTRAMWRQPETRVVVRAAWRHFAAFLPLVHVPWDGEGYGRSRYALASDWLGRTVMQPDPASPGPTSRDATSPASGQPPSRTWSHTSDAARVGSGCGVRRSRRSATSWSTLTAEDGRTLRRPRSDAPRPAADRRARRACSRAGTACCCRTRPKRARPGHRRRAPWRGLHQERRRAADVADRRHSWPAPGS